MPETDLPTGLDEGGIRRIASRVLGRDDALVDEWRCASIYSPTPVSPTLGVFRFSGTAMLPDGVAPWSVILKVIRGGVPDSVEVTAAEREVLAYESSLLEHLGGGLVAPRCYAAERFPPGGCWHLWLEDMGEIATEEWSIDRYELAGRHAGRFSGEFLVRRPLPSQPWLERRGVRRWFDWAGPHFARLAAVRDHPYVRRQWPGDTVEHVLALWAEREAIAAAVERLPRVLVHGDMARRNLLTRTTRSGEQTVGLDWAMTGLGHIGYDAGRIAPSSVHSFALDPERLPDAFEAVFDGYLTGLRDAGWQDDAVLARFGYCASAVLRYGYLPYAIAMIDDVVRAAYVHSFGHPVEESLDRISAEQIFLLGLVDEIHRAASRGIPDS